MLYWVAKLIILVGRVFFIGLNSFVSLRRGLVLGLGFSHFLLLSQGLVCRICFWCCLLLRYLLWLLAVGVLSFFHVYYFTCCIVEFRLFAFLLILRLLLCLLRRILLILGLWTLCRRNHFSLYCLFWLFFIFITLVRWTRELLLWSISPLNPSILFLLFFVLCDLQNDWLLLLLWFVLLRFLFFFDFRRSFLFLWLFLRSIASLHPTVIFKLSMLLINSFSRQLFDALRRSFAS